jgi:hypothetical protein
MDQFRLDIDACMTILGVGGVSDPLNQQPVTQPPSQYIYGRYIG